MIDEKKISWALQTLSGYINKKNEINKKDLERIECLFAQSIILEYCNTGGEVKLVSGKMSLIK